MQLFVEGPTWDGNLVSKSDRDELLSCGLADKNGEGWNFLTAPGVAEAVACGLGAEGWADQRYYRKAAILA